MSQFFFYESFILILFILYCSISDVQFQGITCRNVFFIPPRHHMWFFYRVIKALWPQLCFSAQPSSAHSLLVVDVRWSLDVPVHRRALVVCLTSLNKIFPVRRLSSGVLPVLPHQKLLSARDSGDGRGVIRSMLPPSPLTWGRKQWVHGFTF